MKGFVVDYVDNAVVTIHSPKYPWVFREFLVFDVDEECVYIPVANVRQFTEIAD
jgi:hypothetical protein